MMDGIAALGVLARERTDQVVVTHMSSNHDWAKVSTNRDLDITLGGAMGKASSLGLGVALARPDRGVWVLDGDGSLLMNLGTLVTIAAMKPQNLVHVVCENDAYDTTGGQPIPGANVVDFAAIARGAGYPSTYTFDNLEDFQNRIAEVLHGPQPVLVVLKVPSLGRRPPFDGSRSSKQSFAIIKEQLAQQ